MYCALLQVWSACFSWCVHSAFLAFILRAMALGASVQWLDLLSYTGYAYLPACAIIVAGVLAGEREQGKRGGLEWDKGERM